MVYRIQEDRQKAFCREKNKDIEYSINDIINDPGQFNVFTRELKNKSRIIVARTGQDIDVTNHVHNCELVTYGSNNRHKYKVRFITEDRSSAKETIKSIQKYFQNINEVELTVKYYLAGGAGEISKTIKHAYRDSIPTIVMYDTGVVNDKVGEVKNIKKDLMQYKNRNKNMLFILSPLCIEEMCCQFSRLKYDIVNIEKDDLDFLDEVHAICTTGNNSNILRYLSYDIATASYGAVNWPKLENKYGKIKQLEQMMTCALDNVTTKKQYSFNKRDNCCWNQDCIGNRNICKLADAVGTYTKSPVNMCRKTLLHEVKAEHLVNEQMFQIIYDLFNITTIKSGKYKQSNNLIRYMTYGERDYA